MDEFKYKLKPGLHLEIHVTNKGVSAHVHSQRNSAMILRIPLNFDIPAEDQIDIMFQTIDLLSSKILIPKELGLRRHPFKLLVAGAKESFYRSLAGNVLE